jgi:hypothetical protein
MYITTVLNELPSLQTRFIYYIYIYIYILQCYSSKKLIQVCTFTYTKQSLDRSPNQSTTPESFTWPRKASIMTTNVHSEFVPRHIDVEVGGGWRSSTTSREASFRPKCAKALKAKSTFLRRLKDFRFFRFHSSDQPNLT